MKVLKDGGYAYLLTLNAPGNEGHHRWIAGKRGLHGECSCWRHRLDGDDVWNGSAGERWNRVRTRLRQMYPGMEYVRAVEVQKRGLIHHHVVVWSPEPLAGDEIQRVAMKAGYGCVFDLAPLQNPEKAARYLAKYVSKSVDVRTEVPWLVEKVDQDSGEVVQHRHPTYRSGQASRGWELKMRDLKAMAAKSARVAAARRRDLEQAEELERGQPPTDDGQPGGSGTEPPT